MSNRAKLGFSTLLGRLAYVKADETWLSRETARETGSGASSQVALRGLKLAAPDLLARLGSELQGLPGGVPRAVPQPPSRPRRQRRGPFGEDCVSTAPCPPALPVDMES